VNKMLITLILVSVAYMSISGRTGLDLYGDQNTMGIDYYQDGIASSTLQQTPEPSTVILLGLGWVQLV